MVTKSESAGESNGGQSRPRRAAPLQGLKPRVPNLLRHLSDIRYRTVSDDFFARRSLHRYAGTWSVLAFGVGAVISGEYTGWNPGLIDGGFGGLLVATLVVSVMYVAMCASLAEMASAMPFAGTAYAYSRATMGAWGGFLAGLTQAAAALLTSAVFVVQIGDAVAPRGFWAATSDGHRLARTL